MTYFGRSLGLAAGLLTLLIAASARAQDDGYASDYGDARYPFPERRRAEWVLGPAMGALVMPVAGQTGLAMEFAAFREVDDWAFGGQWTFATTDAQIDSGALFIALALGGRRYFGRGTAGVFVGAGLALSEMVEQGATVTVDTSFCFDPCPRKPEDRRENLKGGGVGAYGEIGLELFRDHPIRLITSARIDVPFWSLKLDNGFAESTIAIVGARRRYEAPVTLNLGVGF